MNLNPMALFPSRKKPRLTAKHMFILIDLYDRLKTGPVMACWDSDFKAELLDLSDMRLLDWSGKTGFSLTPTGKRAVEEREGK